VRRDIGEGNLNLRSVEYNLRLVEYPDGRLEWEE